MGRDLTSAFALDDTRVSRRHAVLVSDAGRVTVADLASRNGTYLNGHRVGGQRLALAPGDVLKIGDFTLVVGPERAAQFAESPVAEAMREVGRARGVGRGPALRARSEDARARLDLLLHPAVRVLPQQLVDDVMLDPNKEIPSGFASHDHRALRRPARLYDAVGSQSSRGGASTASWSLRDSPRSASASASTQARPLWDSSVLTRGSTTPPSATP